MYQRHKTSHYDPKTQNDDDGSIIDTGLQKRFTLKVVAKVMLTVILRSSDVSVTFEIFLIWTDVARTNANLIVGSVLDAPRMLPLQFHHNWFSNS